MKKKFIYLSLIILLLSSSLLLLLKYLQHEEKMQQQSHMILANTQMTYENLRIGVGNIRPADFDENQYTASLWLYIKEHEQLNQQIRVQSGQKVIISVYEITITNISKTTEKAYVEIIITKLNP